MQDNVITLAVDVLNDDTTEDLDYERFDVYQNRTVYTSENHVLTAKDTMTFYRTFPKVNGNFPGTAKTAVKFSTDKVIDGVDGVAALTTALIGEVSFSVPVGVSAADQLILRQRIIALLDDDSIMEPLMNSQSI